MLSPLLLSLALAAGPTANEQARATSAGFDQAQGFASVLVTHVNSVLGSENLPAAMGQPVQPGMFVTIGMERAMLYDRNIAPLQAGRVTDNTIAAECVSRCPAVLFTAFLEAWLEAAIEARNLAIEIPGRILFAAHRDAPMKTVLEVAYAAAETRPVSAPGMALLLNGGKAGLRTLPFHLVPPGGLTMPKENASLALTVTVGAGNYRVTAADPKFGRQLNASTIPDLVALLKDIHRRYASKTTIIYQFDDNATVRQLIEVVQAVKSDFSNVVLSAGQPVTVR